MPHTPDAAGEATLDHDVRYPLPEDMAAAVAPEHYRGGPQSADEIARIEAGGEELTTSEGGKKRKK
jgi:hypothetical protein